MKNKGLITLALALLLLLGGAGYLYSRLSDAAAPALPIGEEEGTSDRVPAPDFTVQTADGGEAKLSDFVGKPVILNFWASWCGPCQMEMPDFEAVWQERGDEVHFLMVNATGGGETVETATDFITKAGYQFPVYLDTEGEASAAYSVYALPTTYFIDAEGNAVTYASGAIDRTLLEQGIELIGG